MKKKLIACLCMISMLASNVMPVFAEGTDSETTTTPVLESVSVVTEPESDRDSMTVPDSFSLGIEVTAASKVQIYMVDVGYARYVDGEYMDNKSFEAETDGEYVGADGKVFDVEIALDEYAASGDYELQYVNIYYGEDYGCIYYEYNDENALEYVNEDNEIVDSLNYDGEADFTVAVHDGEDSEAPELTSFAMDEIAEDAYIHPFSEITCMLGYKENKSGLKTAIAVFESEESDTESFQMDISEEEKLTEGILNISSYERRGGDYVLSQIYLEDIAGNTRTYVVTYTENGEVELDGTATSVIESYAYSVETAHLLVKDISVNKKEVNGGDTVKAYLTLYNPTSEGQMVDPYEWTVTWETEYDGEIKTTDAWGSEQENFYIAPGESATLEIECELSGYTFSGERVLQSIEYEEWDEEWVSFIYENDGDGKLVLDDGKEDGESFSYSGEADFNVTSSDADIKAPEINAIRFDTNSEDGMIYTDTKITIELDYTEEVSGVSWAYVCYRDEDTDEYDYVEAYVDDEKQAETRSGSAFGNYADWYGNEFYSDDFIGGRSR